MMTPKGDLSNLDKVFFPVRGKPYPIRLNSWFRRTRPDANAPGVVNLLRISSLGMKPSVHLRLRSATTDHRPTVRSENHLGRGHNAGAGLGDTLCDLLVPEVRLLPRKRQSANGVQPDPSGRRGPPSG